MSKIFRSIYSLVACVAAAVSKSKKAVSTIAAAVVGIGLLVTPIGAQAQSSFPVVSEVVLSDFDFSSSDWFTCGD